ncbi:MAG: FAD-dependent monooxygenase [Thalassospira sp.]|nr:FAD-dependent monooxygenase [Thalassospira sp.]
METADVVIVGAGVTGCTLALALAQAGLKPLLLERGAAQTAFPNAPQPRTTALNTETISYLESLDLWESLKPHAAPIDRIHVQQLGKKTTLQFDTPEGSKHPMGVIVDNGVLRTLTHQAVSAALPFWSEATLSSIEADAAGVTLQTADGRSVRAPLVVAADGRQSVLSAHFGLIPTRYDYKQSALVAIIEHSEPHHNVAYELFAGDGPIALLPLLGNRSALVWNEETSRAEALLALPEAWFSESVQRATGHVVGTVRLVSKRELHPLVQLLLPRITAPRFAAIGDAAHRIHPLAGQGLNLGMRDVRALVDVLLEAARVGGDVGSAAVLDRYAVRRTLDIRSMAGATFSLNALFRSTNPVVKAGIQLGLGAFARLPRTAALFTRHAMGQSPLARLSTKGIQ